MAVGINIPLINGVAYSHADIKLTILGFPIIGVTSIEYAQMQTIEGNYSTGHLPTSVGYGNVEPSATLTVTMEEYERMLALPGVIDGMIQNIPKFDVRVNYVRQDTSGNFPILVSHRLIWCQFKGPRISSSNNNTQIEVPLEMFVAKISYTG